MTAKYRMEGLHCAGCAEKIRAAAEKLDGVDSADISVATGVLTLSGEGGIGEYRHELQKLTDGIENGVTVVPMKGGRADSHGCEGECAHCHRADESGKTGIIRVLIAAVLAAAGFILGGAVGGTAGTVTEAVLCGAAVAVAGIEVLIGAVKSLLSLSIGENMLAAIAIAAAFAIGEYAEAAAVMILFSLGEHIEEIASGRSRRSVEKLTDIRPDTARLADGSVVRAESVEVGTEIVIHAFERIPIDGEIVDGTSYLDTSALTGESIPVAASAGVRVMSGMSNGDGVITVRTTADYGDSAASRIVRLVEDSAANKGSAERIITKFARVYTPCICVFAILLTVIPGIITGEWTAWLYRSLVVLMASCPCAMVISVPLAFYAAIGAASRASVLIKGGIFVEKLAKVDTVAFDKTGTVTTGRLSVTEILAFKGKTEEYVLRTAALLEKMSDHPIAAAVCDMAGKTDDAVGSISEAPGKGVILRGEKTVLCGSRRLLDDFGIDCSGLPEAQIYVAEDGDIIGAIRVGDTVRADAAGTVAELKKTGVGKIAMLTGDSAAAACAVAAECGIDTVRHSLLPEDKVSEMKKLCGSRHTALFAGDGINDAPVLAAADVGAAMGLGSDAAVEAADIVLMGNSLAALPFAIKLSRRAVGTVRFNIAFALAVKAAVLISAIFVPQMWLAVAADVGVCVLSVLNSVRLLRMKRKQG